MEVVWGGGRAWVLIVVSMACVVDDRESASAGEVTGGIGTSDTGGEESGDGGGSGCHGVINNDECSGPFALCASPYEIQRVHQVDCYEVYVNYCYCSNPVCDGLEAPESCPPETVCVEVELGVGDYEAQCLPRSGACGGPSRTACSDGEYCHYRTHQCPACALDPDGCEASPDHPWGVCEPIPDPDTCPDDAPQVCGCDDVTYPSPCDAAAAGVSLRSTGACG